MRLTCTDCGKFVLNGDTITGVLLGPLLMIFMGFGFVYALFAEPSALFLILPMLLVSIIVTFYPSNRDTKCPDCVTKEFQNNYTIDQKKLQERLDRNVRLKGLITQFQQNNDLSGLNETIINEFETALKYESSSNYEGAAQIYEKHELWTEAATIRNKSRVVKNVNIDLNLNQLIEKISRSGLAVNYRCSVCGAPISIDGSSGVDGLKFCSYCGSAINTNALIEVLKAAIS